VLLIDEDGFSYAEAATIDGREGTIASRLNRAHTTLRTLLDNEGRTS
jgi:DNA-directed RNA polymerase specialized sigma24 family protein